MTTDQIVYTVFGIVILIALTLDLGFLSKKNTTITIRQAMRQTFLWVLLALGFFVFMWVEEGQKIAFEYLTKAVELGDVDAHYQLSVMYHEGNGVEKDEKKELHHLEEAAIAGHPVARHNLGCYEWKNERFDRAVKHFIIAAKLGHDDSLDILKKGYTWGDVSKEDFAAALRGHRAAVDATKSPQREAAEAA